jgi:Cytochrome c554 and c-prime
VRRSLPLRFVLLIAVCRLGAIAGADAREEREGAEFMGAASCSSSSCHGGAGEKRSQYLTWVQKDFHSRAFSILLDARSARIAEAVGVGPAQSSARCTVCHSPFQSVAPARLASSAHPDEGVSCESCHGAAGPWFRGHTRPDWTYAMRVSAGMRDLRNIYERANACVACHQNIDDDILRAGHPALVFELDSQSIDEPRHWKETGPWSGPRCWLTGQAVALREMSWAFVTGQMNPKETDRVTRWRDLAALLDKAVSVQVTTPNELRLVQVKAFGAMQQRADEIARQTATSTWTPERVRQLRLSLSAESPTDAQSAARLVLALESLTRALASHEGALPPGASELKAMREDVRSAYDFDPARFALHLRDFQKALR